MLLSLSISSLLSSLLLLSTKTFISIEIPMINIMNFNLPISILLDWTSLIFLSTVTFISSMIMLFSIFYIPPKEHKQFSILMLMFILSMGILISSDNLIFILLGWDGLGLSSYILVIFYKNHQSAASGSITILSNRLGDIMILLSISIMMSSSNWNFSLNEEFMLISLLLLMIAACSKSAQFPFSAWLPAAMAAPTPISALVHSSTLVTAGVFLMIRIMNNPHPLSLFILMIISSSTMIFSSISANWENDMKKIIALSTLSQIAMMMFALSINLPNLAFSHLIIHALFKSLMFMCAGVLIHNSTYQDMHMMGLNSSLSPSILSTLGISNLALMAIPFMSGFFSKDPIIENLIEMKLSSIPTILMIMSVGLTASYSFRLINLSLKLSSNSKPDNSTHYSNMFSIPITLMTPLSISSGSMMSWISNPQISFIPNPFKLSLTILLFLGMTLGLSSQFKQKTFSNLGQSAISLWFNHFTSTWLNTPTSPIMKTYLNNDKTWNETYGPKTTFITMKKLSNLPSLILPSLLLTITMMFLIPMII